MHQFTPEQIKEGRRLKRWFLKYPLYKERPQEVSILVARLLRSYPLSKIKSRMSMRGSETPEGFLANLGE